MKRKIYKKLQETISRSRKLTKRAWKIEQETWDRDGMPDKCSVGMEDERNGR